jgi:hypothetical protein
MTTFALVLETNNLTGGGADAARTAQSLERLLARLREQTRPLAMLDEFVITHDGLASGARARLDAIAGKPIRWVEIDADTDYYEAKNRGFDATSTDVVAFADADCWPEPAWLEELFAPFGDAAVEVTAGRTTYRTDVLGTGASTIDFMYFDSPLAAGCTRNFYANNVAFRREIFAQRRYPRRDSVYRGHCQLLGLRLLRDGIAVRFAPEAHTVHRLPDSRRELLRLRWLRGSDAAELTPAFAQSALPRGLSWLGRAGPLSVTAVLGARFGCGVWALGRRRVLPRGLGALAGVHAADRVGAMVGRARVDDVLSYHGDTDGLA